MNANKENIKEQCKFSEISEMKVALTKSIAHTKLAENKLAIAVETLRMYAAPGPLSELVEIDPNGLIAGFLKNYGLLAKHALQKIGEV